jgi:high-affinity Fe2+/Pb2+ permease
MRKTLIALSAAAALTATAASPALSNPRHHHHHHNAWVAPGVGVAAGTIFGVGLYNGWWGASTTAAAGSLATSTTGAAVAGGLAGVGTVAAIHAATTKCQGFHALFGGSGCVNGQYVGERVAYRR